MHHIDGWDKLKRYGLCVHGCIDGFCRKILWLEVEYSNNSPDIVCKYFSQCISHLNGIPYVIRADRGTENVNIEFMQTVLRSLNNDERGHLQTTFLYGRSTSNQRIEAWWSKFPCLGTKVWITHFKQLEDHRIIDTSRKIDIQSILFCYLDLLRHELNTIKTAWNTHRIRPSRHQTSPSGKPDVMFFMPHIYNTISYLQDVDMDVYSLLSELLTRNASAHNCLPIYAELFQTLCDERGLISRPSSLNEAADMLVLLLDAVDYLYELNNE